MYETSCAWEDMVYNLGRSHLDVSGRYEVCDIKRRWQKRSPAMAARLTDHIWSVEEILTTIVALNT